MRLFTACPVVLLVAVMSWQPAPRDAGEAEFRAFLTEFEAGLDRFVNGDHTRWKQNLSRSRGDHHGRVGRLRIG